MCEQSLKYSGELRSSKICVVFFDEKYSHAVTSERMQKQQQITWES